MQEHTVSDKLKRKNKDRYEIYKQATFLKMTTVAAVRMWDAHKSLDGE